MEKKEKEIIEEMLFLLKSTTVVRLVSSNPSVSLDAIFLHTLHSVLHMGLRFAALLSGKMLRVYMLINMWYIAMIFREKSHEPGYISLSWFNSVKHIQCLYTSMDLSKELMPLELRRWRRLLRDPWTAERSNPSVLREINLKNLLEGLLLTLHYADLNSWLIGKVHWGLEEKRASEDEMAGWHHRCNEHELGRTSGDGEGQRPGVLPSVGSQRAGQDWATEQELICPSVPFQQLQGTIRNVEILTSGNVPPTLCSRWHLGSLNPALLLKKLAQQRGLWGCPVVKTWPSKCRGHRFGPWSGNH